MNIHKCFRNWCQGAGAGGANAAGVPEISGGVNFGVGNGGGWGAFAFLYGGDYGQMSVASNAAYYFDFKASRSNDIYGSSETVMPESVNIPIAIYLGTSS